MYTALVYYKYLLTNTKYQNIATYNFIWWTQLLPIIRSPPNYIRIRRAVPIKSKQLRCLLPSVWGPHVISPMCKQYKETLLDRQQYNVVLPCVIGKHLTYIYIYDIIIYNNKWFICLVMRYMENKQQQAGLQCLLSLSSNVPIIHLGQYYNNNIICSGSLCVSLHRRRIY